MVTTRSLISTKRDNRALVAVVKDSGAQVFFHQSSWSKEGDLREPVKSGKSKNSYRASGTAATGSSTQTMGLTLRNLIYWGMMGSICNRRGKDLQSQACQAGEEGFKLKSLEKDNLNPSNSYQFDASASNRCPEPREGSQISRTAPKEQHEGISATPTSKSASSGAQLKCLYVKVHNTGNK